LEKALDDKKIEIRHEEISQRLVQEKLDVTLPGAKILFGTAHPLTQVQHKLVRIFSSLGFSVEEGPDIESDYYNFGALNFPDNHPARDMQDTFFTTDQHVLRTHTSPVQVRMMEKQAPPIRMIVPGRVYRHDADATHSPVFHQIEGLCVGPHITFAHLKGTLEAFVAMMFGKDAQTRFRPSFFPFTEPSAELDVMGPTGNWMEILGCGMVDPAVFENIAKVWAQKHPDQKENPYDPEKVSGFAFGMGIERIAMIDYGVKDIKLFYENDVQFLEQF
ncbi:MAG: phenylalanine--tRNA ligase subunit alpha, partial [Deltaproteobacteria bacterium]|nr:phenylalanine--tRNA ligase subunit alpha [Deltaproteobacteria bacterium]